MLNELGPQQQADVRLLWKLVNGEGSFVNVEHRDEIIDRLKNHISDVVLTILMKESGEQLKHFLTNK